MTLKLFVPVIMAVTLSACSTVNRGTSDHFRIDTVPQGAKVTTSVPKKTGKTRADRRKSKSSNSEYVGCYPTPCAIRLPRRSEFVAQIEHPGYEPVEIFIRSSTMRGGTTASAAANLASSSGTGFALAGYIAAMESLFTSIFTLGSQSVNTSGIAASGAATGLGIGVGMIAIDAASGANLNLFPNPVVIELAPDGTPVRTDPLVDLYWDMTEAKTISDAICKKRKKDRNPDEPSCSESKASYQLQRRAFQDLKREQLNMLKAAIKEAKAKQKAAQAEK